MLAGCTSGGAASAEPAARGLEVERVGGRGQRPHHDAAAAHHWLPLAAARSHWLRVRSKHGVLWMQPRPALSLQVNSSYSNAVLVVVVLPHPPCPSPAYHRFACGWTRRAQTSPSARVPPCVRVGLCVPCQLDESIWPSDLIHGKHDRALKKPDRTAFPPRWREKTDSIYLPSRHNLIQ